MRHVTVYADVLCPFTHVGLRVLTQRRAAAGRDEPRLDVRAWPLEIINGAALDAHHVAAEIEGLRAVVAPEMFQGFDLEHYPTTTMPAFALTAAAAATGDLLLVERVALAIRNALYEEGRDISDPEVVAALGHEFGIAPLDDATTRAALDADLERGRARGVIGSPHFFADDGANWFCPALAISRDDAGRFIIDWKDGGEEFIERILA